MINDYLSSFTKNIVEFKKRLHPNTIGSKIDLYDSNKSDYESVDIAILGINEYRNSIDISSKGFDLDGFRKEFYSLFIGDWKVNILDLGNLLNGNTYKDTYFAFKSICDELLKQDVLLICIGGGNDFAYPIYQSLCVKKNKINFTSIDNKFDLGKIKKDFNSNTYMSQIIMDSKNSLNHFCNLGFQTFLNSQEEIDLLNKLNFEFHRLGKLNRNLLNVEPVLRDTDFLSVDFKSIKASELNFVHNFPNGFNSREICSISRYAGISNRVLVLGFFELFKSEISSALLSQCVWYFIEGYSLRADEDPKSENFNGYHYNVYCQGANLKFYNSELTQKWWVEFLDKDKNPLNRELIPCTKNDYLKAIKEILTDRMILMLRRDFV